VERWSISLRKEDFRFSCAHFLIFPDGSKERLHGHNYRVACEIGGPLCDRGLVLDFNRAKPLIRGLCDELDERWLLPVQHPELAIDSAADGHLEVRYRGRRYQVPADEVLRLPVNNISVENLAAWLGRRLRAVLTEQIPGLTIDRLRLEVAEQRGQSGIYEWTA
jgi:6-pyruvoyltetrahydropterin/6-carboxytetrahydropterin synthase